MRERRDVRIDGLRGVAALTVVLPHTALLLSEGSTANATSAITLGFALLFVVSGLLLYLPFAHDVVRDDRRVDIGAYARNRVLRLLPAPAVVLAAAVVLQVRPFADPWLLAPLPVFALVLPLLWRLARHLDDGEARIRAVLLPGVLLLLVGIAGLATDTALGHAVPFALGMLAAATTVGMTGRRTFRRKVWNVRRGALVTLAVALALALPSSVPESLHRFQPAVLATAAAATLTVLRLPGRGVRRYLTAMFELVPLRRAGAASAGLVLWHVPLALAVREYWPEVADGTAESFLVAFTLVLVATWLLAEATWLLVEKPVLRLRRPAMVKARSLPQDALPQQRVEHPAPLVVPLPPPVGGKHRGDLPPV